MLVKQVPLHPRKRLKKITKRLTHAKDSIKKRATNSLGQRLCAPGGKR